MRLAFARLAVRLQAEPRLREHPGDRPVAHRVPLRLEFCFQVADALRRPPQRRVRVPPRHGGDQRIQIVEKSRVRLDRLLPPRAGAHAREAGRQSGDE